jgi:hypothetical protein
MTKPQVQELYRHLDCMGSAGDRHIAWYGQLRAEEMSHDEALEATISHFRLTDEVWYQRRFPNAKATH